MHAPYHFVGDGVLDVPHRRGTMPTSSRPCHSEPVRAAKQVPLGYTLAWESVSPRLPLRGRCQREALTEGEMPRVFLSPSRLRRQPPPRGGLAARRCRAVGTSGTPSPTKTTRRPGWGAARFPSMCGTDGGGLYSPLLQAGTAGADTQKSQPFTAVPSMVSLPVVPGTKRP